MGAISVKRKDGSPTIERAQGPGRALGTPLTPAQQRDLLEALRVHPGTYEPATQRVALRLVDAGMLEAVVEPRGFRLTPIGLDVAARLSAQRVIDAVNRNRDERTTSDYRTLPSVDQPSVGKPANWPFPVSAHDW